MFLKLVHEAVFLDSVNEKVDFYTKKLEIIYKFCGALLQAYFQYFSGIIFIFLLLNICITIRLGNHIRLILLQGERNKC